MYCVCISSPSNASFIEFITVYSLVLITSCNLNPRFLLRLHDLSVLQSIIIFNAKSLRINFLYDCFFGSSINSYLRFLYFSSNLFVTASKFYVLIVVLHAFHLAIIYQIYLLLLLYHYFHMFLW